MGYTLGLLADSKPEYGSREKYGRESQGTLLGISGATLVLPSG